MNPSMEPWTDPLVRSTLGQASPPTLVGVPGAAETGGDTPGGVSFASTAAITTVVCIAIACAAVLAWRRLAVCRAKSARSSAVFVTMCRGMKLTSADQRLLRQLAKREGTTSPVTLILCLSVFERAAADAGASVDRASVHRLRQKLAA